MITLADALLLSVIMGIILVPLYCLRKSIPPYHPRLRLRITLTKPHADTVFGVTFAKPTGSEWIYVEKLEEHSLLRMAGVRIGDRVIAVGEKLLFATSARALKAALTEAPPGVLVLTIARQITVDLNGRRQAIFKVNVPRPSPAFPLGVTLRSGSEGTAATIESLDESAPLSNAGCLPGDVILRIDGLEPTGAASASTLLKMAGATSDTEDAPLMELVVARSAVLAIDA